MTRKASNTARITDTQMTVVTMYSMLEEELPSDGDDGGLTIALSDASAYSLGGREHVTSLRLVD